MYYNNDDNMNDKIISVRIMPEGYGKASKEVRDYILSLHDEIVELQQENERIEKEWKSKLDDVSMLTSRISKAIEWLDYDNMENYFECPKKEMLELLSILQGEDNER